MSRNDGPGPRLDARLAYLLKHAHLRMTDLHDAALAPHGVDGRELGALLALAAHQPMSQQQMAQRLSVDRTTMVALLDALEGKGLVSRHPDAGDRRRNVVELTGTGRDTLRDALAASDEAERAFLAPLDPEAARHLRTALRAVTLPSGDA
jgi:DNA-binding MarR family transcriptional regulator